MYFTVTARYDSASVTGVLAPGLSRSVGTWPAIRRDWADAAHVTEPPVQPGAAARPVTGSPAAAGQAIPGRRRPRGTVRYRVRYRVTATDRIIIGGRGGTAPRHADRNFSERRDRIGRCITRDESVSDQR